jgi:hypothetical protein
MKKLLLPFCVLCVAICSAQNVNFPDTFFKAKLLSAAAGNQIAYSNGASIKIDANDDGEIEVGEATVIDSLNVSSAQIINITGISAFNHLKMLDCSHNNISTLDTSVVTGLTILNCSNNPLTDLDISLLPDLNFLKCDSTHLEHLTLAGPTNLNYLYCSYNNSLTAVDFSGASGLMMVNISDDPLLSSLDPSGQASIIYLFCDVDNLNTLNISGLNQLVWLSCEENSITALDLSNKPNLYEVDIMYNSIASLDLTGLSLLHELNVYNNNLTTLDISVVPGLNTLNCSSNQITAIDFSNSSGLVSFSGENNLFTEVDLSHSPLLMGAALGNNTQLTSVNIKNGSFNYLDCNSDTALQFVCADEGDISVLLNDMEIYGLTGVVINSYCSFTPGGNFNAITGTLRLDANNDGCDALDAPLKYQKINITDGTATEVAFTNTSGMYTYYTGQGDFSLMPAIENPSFFTISPFPATVSFPDNNGNIDTQDFCLTTNGVHPDLEVVLVPISSAWPGFLEMYKIIYRNKGNQTLSGTLEFNFDDAVQDYASSSMPPDVQATGILAWNYTDLLPFETREITVTLHVNSQTDMPPVNSGDELTFVVTGNPITTDESPTDNSSSLTQTVVGSYDPNNITCLEGDIAPINKIGDYLHYAINFENTGTAAAQNIAVSNIIDTTKFDISSLQLISTSHPAQVHIAGTKVEFIFEGIGLAEQAVGDIVFKIKTLPTLPEGTTVTNQANIYFDYNFPVETNTASTAFTTLSAHDFGSNAGIKIYPNPVSDNLNVASKSQLKSIEIYDAQARLVLVNLASETQSSMDVSSLGAGVYFVKVMTVDAMVTTKIMKQ